MPREAAIKAAKRQLQGQGLKVNQMERKVIVAAPATICEHPELIAETYDLVQSSPELRALFDKEQREWQRHRAKFNNHAQKAEA